MSGERRGAGARTRLTGASIDCSERQFDTQFAIRNKPFHRSAHARHRERYGATVTNRERVMSDSHHPTR